MFLHGVGRGSGSIICWFWQATCNGVTGSISFTFFSWEDFSPCGEARVLEEVCPSVWLLALILYAEVQEMPAQNAVSYSYSPEKLYFCSYLIRLLMNDHVVCFISRKLMAYVQIQQQLLSLRLCQFWLRWVTISVSSVRNGLIFTVTMCGHDSRTFLPNVASDFSTPTLQLLLLHCQHRLRWVLMPISSVKWSLIPFL